MKPKDISEWIKASLHEVKNERAPWSLDKGPVDKRRVVELIRQLGREFEKGIIVAKGKPTQKQVSSKPLSYYASVNNDTWDKAKELLRQLPNSGGLPKLEKAHKRYLESLKG